MIVISSGAAVRGSPLSRGYAGAKATERFITAYAQDEAQRGGPANSAADYLLTGAGLKPLA